MTVEDILIKKLEEAHSVFVLTGAGLGVASGLNTFRSINGYWKNYDVQRLASFAGFFHTNDLHWDWYNERIEAYLAAQPNAGHFALVELESLVPEFRLATQNVDGLHLRAGHKTNVLELHGDLRRVRCQACGEKRAITGSFDYENDLIHQDCPKDGVSYPSWFRPNVVWFDEQLSEHIFQLAVKSAQYADVIIVAGTSLNVFPAAQLVNPDLTRAVIFEINPESRTDGYSIKEGTETALPRIVKRLKENRAQDKVLDEINPI